MSKRRTARGSTSGKEFSQACFFLAPNFLGFLVFVALFLMRVVAGALPRHCVWHRRP